jgi:mannan endo-1,4-beta-mannosidase
MSDNSRHLHVRERFLTTPAGEKVVLRGVNEMFVWGDRKGDVLEQIARTGANCVRIVWTVADGTAFELAAVIDRCRALGMLPIPEFHDATGDWEKLEVAVSGWLRDDYREALLGRQDFLVVNIANEVGRAVPDDAFVERYSDAVLRLRTAGYRCPLLVDATDWGKDWSQLSRTGARLIESDPDRNMLLSLHLWWPAKSYGGTLEEAARRTREALSESVQKGLPLVVAEFGAAFTDAGVVAVADRIPWEVLLEECHRLEIGWLAWSWGGVPNQPQKDLDMAPGGRLEDLRGWGREVALDHPLSIRNTARPIRRE